MLYMGIDVGTQGVRCAVSDENGILRAGCSVPFKALSVSDHEGWLEQRPRDWADACEKAIRGCTEKIERTDEIRAISIDGTSGTIVPLDREHRPLMNGIMYNDPRAGVQAKRVHEAMTALEKKMGYRFGSSYSLPRMLWIRDELPDIYEKTSVFAHEADYILGLLTGVWGVSDYSNALKSGYDLLAGRWPEEIAALGLDIGKLPEIVRPGAPVAPVSKEAAERFGLSEKTVVSGGSTDGYASALAAGAVREGSWASVIGTTFVLKGVTKELLIDPSGASYSHRLPDGSWLLGGASNLGGRTLNGAADGRTFDEMNERSAALIPTGIRCYPLPGRGERFPFVKSDFEPFYIGNPAGGRLYPAVMEGVAFAERLSLERMEKLGASVGDTILTTGGACKSDLWLKIRASVLNKRLRVPENVDAAMGSALLAASGDFGSLGAAAEKMIRIRKTAEPDAALSAQYNEIYARFLGDMRSFGAEV